MNKLVWHTGQLYMPVNFQTGLPDQATMNKDNTIWVALDDDRFRLTCNVMLNILFATPAEERSFHHMVRQLARQVSHSDNILVKVNDHLEVMDSRGKLSPTTGDFVANFMDVPYEPGNPLVDELWKIIVSWLDSEEQAHSLLYHIATALQSSWSAARYILLIGEGRNGKSTLLKMLIALFGTDNVSGISRQKIAALSPIMRAVNGKLLNIVLDGSKEFVKDSSSEKTLIVGEPLTIEMKYENTPVIVQTNALFMEGLQEEPMLGDKSRAIQSRLIRFYFPNEYALDLGFEAKMLQPDMLAALLVLLMQHWVNKEEVASKLAPTAESMDLRLEAVWKGSPILRFLEYIAQRDADFLPRILDGKMRTELFLPVYRDWLATNGYKSLEDDYLLHQMSDCFTLDRKAFRLPENDNRPTRRRYIKGIKSDTMNAITELLKGNSLEAIEDGILEG